MTKKIINVNAPNDFINTGSAPNARDGDSLRSSFARINDAIDNIDANFAEIYAGDVEVDLSAVDQHIVPATNLTYNLGSPDKKFHSIYVGTGSVYLGNARLSFEDGKIKSTVGFDLTGSVGVVGGTVSYADVTNKPTIPTNTNQLTNGAGFITSTSQLVNGVAELTLNLNGSTPYVTFPAHEGESVIVQGSEIGSTDSALVLSSFDNRVIIGANAQGPRKNWEFGTDGKLTLPDGAKYAGKTITMPTTTNGTTNSFVWEFSDQIIGSDTITLDWNLLATNQSSFYFGTTHSTNGKYLFLDGADQSLSYFASGVPGNGKLLFGRSAGNNAGDINAIELKAAAGDIYLTSTESVKITVDASDSSARTWIFDPTGNLTIPAGGGILDSTGTSILGSLTGNIEFRNDSMNDINGITITNADQTTAASAQIVIPANTGGGITINNVEKSTESNTIDIVDDFTAYVTLVDGITTVKDWSQRNPQQIEVNLFVNPAGPTYTLLTGLALGRTVIVQYTNNVNATQTFTSVLSQQFTSTGQADPSNNWVRLGGRIDGTLPADVNTLALSIDSVDFPVDVSTNRNWIFEPTGQLTVPGPGSIRGDNALYLNSGGTTNDNSASVFVNGTAGQVILRTDNGTSTKSLTFDVDGDLTVPGALYVTTGLDGTIIGTNGVRIIASHANPLSLEWSLSGETNNYAGNPALNTDNASIQFGLNGVNIEVNNPNNGGSWTFGPDGALTLPAQASTLQTVDQIFTTKIYRATDSTDNTAIQDAWNVWYGHEMNYQNIVDQDRTLGGHTWPWDGLPSYEGYPLLMDYNSSGQPVPGVLPPSSSLAPAANVAMNAYIAYRELVSNIDIVSGNKTFGFKNTGELSLPGTLSFADTANAKIVLKQTDPYGIVVEGVDQLEWIFGSNGTLSLPQVSSVGAAVIQPNDATFGIKLISNNNVWAFGTDGVLAFPNNARQRDTGSVNCGPNADTVIYTGTNADINTIKLIVQAEGQEGGSGSWHTQSCEILVAKSFNGNTVVATVYAVVHTSNSPLATFTANWNGTSSRVEVKCRPVSTLTNIYVRTFATEILTAD